MIHPPSPTWASVLGYVWTFIGIPLLYALSGKRRTLRSSVLTLCAASSVAVGLWVFFVYGPLTANPRWVQQVWIPWGLAVGMCVLLYRHYVKPRPSE